MEQARRFSALGRTSLAIIAVVFLSLFAVLAVWIWTSYETARRRGDERIVAASKIVSTNASWTLALARQALRRIDESLGADLKANGHEGVRDLKSAVSGLPEGVSAYVVDAEGRTIYSADSLPEPILVKDRSYFAAMASGATEVASSLMISRLDGKQVFVLGRRLERNGAFIGAAVVSIEGSILQNVWEAVDMGVNSTVSLIRRDGMLVARYPQPDGPVDMRNYVLFTDYLKKANQGTYFAESPIDGARRIVAYRAVSDTPYIAIASADYSQTMRPFWDDLQIAAWVLLISLVGAAAAGRRIYQLMQADAARTESLSRAVETNRLLMREIHHRVKNNLQTVQALLRMHRVDPDTYRDLSGRISAMSTVHQQIYTQDRFAGIPARDLLPSLVDTVVATYDRNVSTQFEIDDVVIDTECATSFALLVNELVTNAMKYAFEGRESGTIRVVLRHLTGPRVELVVADDGPGFDLSRTSAGMGRRLIDGVTAQMNGQFAYSMDGGTRFSAELDAAAPADEEPKTEPPKTENRPKAS